MNTGINISDQQREAVAEQLLGGQKIAAIKLYRDATGAGLAEAKEAVEALDKALRTDGIAQPPPHSSNTASSAGGTSTIGSAVGLIVAAAIGLAVWWFVV